MDSRAVAELVKRTRVDRGLPMKVADPVVIARLATLLAVPPGGCEPGLELSHMKAAASVMSATAVPEVSGDLTTPTPAV